MRRQTLASITSSLRYHHINPMPTETTTMRRNPSTPEKRRRWREYCDAADQAYQAWQDSLCAVKQPQPRPVITEEQILAWMNGASLPAWLTGDRPRTPTPPSTPKLEVPPFPEDLRGLECGARAKGTGRPCRRTDIHRNGRCKFHGGMSTGPRTMQGKARAAANGFKSVHSTRSS